MRNRGCISRFKDCPLCGADIEKIEEDEKIQGIVDRFIEGHARIKRTQVDSNAENKEEAGSEPQKNKMVIYEDVSLERGAFLVQHAMRVSMLFEFLAFCSSCQHYSQYLLVDYLIYVSLIMNLAFSGALACFFIYFCVAFSWCFIYLFIYF